MNIKKISGHGIWISLVFAFLPLISLLLGIVLGLLFGCGDINEGSAPDCFMGELIYVLTVMMWFILITFPIGIGIALICSIVYLILFLKK